MTVTLDVAGLAVGFAHGHQAKYAGTPQAKVWRWWERQSHGETSIGSAQLLLTGHWHHLSVIRDGPKSHIQCPTLDGGSPWFEHTTAKTTTPGTVTVVCGPDGWDHLRIL